MPQIKQTGTVYSGSPKAPYLVLDCTEIALVELGLGGSDFSKLVREFEVGPQACCLAVGGFQNVTIDVTDLRNDGALSFTWADHLDHEDRLLPRHQILTAFTAINAPKGAVELLTSNAVTLTWNDPISGAFFNVLTVAGQVYRVAARTVFANADVNICWFIQVP